MPKLGDIVTFVTGQGQPRIAFVSAEVIEQPEDQEEPEEERQAREQREAEEADRTEQAHKQREAEIAAESEVQKAAHEEAEARAGGPIQRIALVPPTPTPALPVPVENKEEEPEDVTGPELTLHVLLHTSDHDYGTHGLLAVYSGVKHSEKARPHTWH